MWCTHVHTCTHTHTHTHKMEYYSAIKKNGILPFATTWMDLEGIMLSEISQTEKDRYCMISLICGILKIKQGFPGGAVVESLPANAGDTGSSPGPGGSRMPRSNWAREPHLLSLCVWSLCSATREATAVRGPRTAMKSDPRLPQLEKALAQKRRPNTAKNK